MILLKKIITKIIHFFWKKQTDTTKREYNIGNRKDNNSLIDTMFPKLITIGDNFISAPGSIILAHDASLFTHNQSYICKRTSIGNNVFVGANAVILAGVNIGNNVIVGAGAIVTKDVPNNVVVVGNPAKVVSSIENYIDKTKNSEFTFKTPQSFDKVLSGESITNEMINEFRKKVYNKLKITE